MHCDFIKINKVLKEYFPKAKIVFGGSVIRGNVNEYSDIDVYLIFRFFWFFYQATKDVETIKEIKRILQDERINIHLIPNIFLRIGYYQIKGFYFYKKEKKDFIFLGSSYLTRLNSVKLCLKNLAWLKFSEDIKDQEKFKHNFLKNLKFLEEENISESQFMQTLKDRKSFYIRDWLLFCFWHRRFLPFNFEKIVINAFYYLIKYIETQDDKYKNILIKLLKKIEKREIKSFDLKYCLRILDKYVFLIFLV